MSRADFLDGEEWLVRTSIELFDVVHPEIVLTHEVAIRATSATREQWNGAFWRIFDNAGVTLDELVSAGAVRAIVAFPFHPTVTLRKKYGGQDVMKISRIADNSRAGALALPPDMVEAVEQYMNDKARLDAQRRTAWQSLLETRLPAAPSGYVWELDEDPDALKGYGRSKPDLRPQTAKEQVRFRLIRR